MLSKDVLEEFRLECQLRRLADRTIKGYYNSTLFFLTYLERQENITERAIQKQLGIVCDYLGYTNISTHSFRKYYATSIYKANGYDIALVQRLLQHSNAATTQRYIGIEPQRIETAIMNHVQLL